LAQESAKRMFRATFYKFQLIVRRQARHRARAHRRKTGVGVRLSFA
jgi:hypothetical protein